MKKRPPLVGGDRLIKANLSPGALAQDSELIWTGL